MPGSDQAQPHTVFIVRQGTSAERELQIIHYPPPAAKSEETLCKSGRYMRLKWDLGGWLNVAELLLLLELLVGGLDGDGEADLGLLL